MTIFAFKNSLFQKTATRQFISQQLTMMDKIAGHGLKIECLFTRLQNLFSNEMCSIYLRFTNESNKTINKIQLVVKVCTEKVILDKNWMKMKNGSLFSQDIHSINLAY